MIAPITAEVGEQVVFSGYADDFGRKIDAIEFSLDGGKTWSSRSVSGSNPSLKVNWTYSYTPQKPGHYTLLVQSVASDGRRSPQADSADLYVGTAL